ncbi:MAG: hypothetical protein V7L20_04585 [Nostoc sp.]|uniref:hypothetical protein n=1 Tax=Nostoc sp. TaxID=1180 RepID=UPI002FF72405
MSNTQNIQKDRGFYEPTLKSVKLNQDDGRSFFYSPSPKGDATRTGILRQALAFHEWEKGRG